MKTAVSPNLEGPVEDISLQSASVDIWDKKYRLKTKSGDALDQDIDDSKTGLSRKQHMRVSAGMEDKADIIGGYFILSIEVEEDLIPVLARLNGNLRILSTTIKLVGGGIDKAIEELNTPNINLVNDDYEEDNADDIDPTVSEPVVENVETLYNNLQEGDGTYMLDTEDLMDQADTNPSDPSS